MASIFDDDFFKNILETDSNILGEDLIKAPEQTETPSTTATTQKAQMPGMMPVIIKGSEGRDALKKIDERLKKARAKKQAPKGESPEEEVPGGVVSPYGNKVLDDYYKKLLRQEDKLQDNRKINMSSPMSERYYFNGDIGQQATKANGLPNAKTSGWTGLYTKRQMIQSGEDIGQKDVDIAEIPSTAVQNIRYNPKTKNLYIKFVGGKKEYLYPGVPEEAVRKFLTANSKGRYVGNRLKKYAVSAAEAQRIKSANKGE